MRSPKLAEEIWNSLKRELKHNLICADMKLCIIQNDLTIAGIRGDKAESFLSGKLAELMDEVREERRARERG